MKVSIPQAPFREALGRVGRVVEKRSTVAVLSNLLIRASNGEVEIVGTDTDIEVVERLAAGKVDEPGAVTVPAAQFSEVVRKTSGDTLSIETSGADPRAVVRSGRSRFVMPTIAADLFPRISAGDFGATFDMPGKDLKRLFGKTYYATSTEETRYYLQGVYFHVVQDASVARLRGVGTDGHKLSRVTVDLPQGAGAMPGVIVPRKCMAELPRIIGDEPVRIEVSEAKIRFTAGARTFTSKLVDGAFPDYERALPSGEPVTLTAERTDMVAAVDRVTTMLTERTSAGRFVVENREMIVQAVGKDGGEGDDVIAVDYDGARAEVSINARYVLETLQQIDGDTVSMHLHGPGMPVLFTDPAEPDLLFLTMPMRV